MYSLEEFQDYVMELEEEYLAQVPGAFYNSIARQWFLDIFPYKSDLYGIEGMQRLGPVHCVAEYTGCFYRWRRLKDNEFSVSDPPMYNAIVDAFGYSVLMRAMASLDKGEDVSIVWHSAKEKRRPKKDLDIMLGFYWDDRVPVDQAACTMALRCTLNMHRLTSS